MVAPMKYYRIGLQKIRLEKVGSFQLSIFVENGCRIIPCFGLLAKYQLVSAADSASIYHLPIKT